MAGSSAGAVTSLLVDWRSEDPGSSGNPGFSSAIRGAVSISGGAPTNEAIDGNDPPAIFFHGDQDSTVPFEWALNNAAAMYEAGIFTVLRVLTARVTDWVDPRDLRAIQLLPLLRDGSRERRALRPG